MKAVLANAHFAARASDSDERTLHAGYRPAAVDEKSFLERACSIACKPLSSNTNGSVTDLAASSLAHRDPFLSHRPPQREFSELSLFESEMPRVEAKRDVLA